MITVANYQAEINKIDWSKLPAAIKNEKQGIDDIIEFYNDDDDIKNTVDLFIDLVNKNLPKVEKPKTQTKKEIPDPSVVEEVENMSLRRIMSKTKYLQNVMPAMQQQALFAMEKSEEREFFVTKILELDDVLKNATKPQNGKLMDSIVKLHFFYGNTDWFILDFQPKEKSFFGYVVLNGDVEMSEAGYISIDELLSVKRVEMDFYWNEKPLLKALNSKYPTDFPIEKESKKEEPKKPIDKTSKDLYIVKDGKVLTNHGMKDFWFTDNPFFGHRIEDLAGAKRFAKHYKGKVVDGFENMQSEVENYQTKAPTKQKVKKLLTDKDIESVASFTPEFMLIRRFFNVLKSDAVQPFAKVRNLYMAFQKAAISRTVRKTSEDADLFSKVSEKVTKWFTDFAEPNKADVKITSFPADLKAEIQDYVENRKVSPAVSLLKRFVSMQGTQPNVKSATTLLNAITKLLEGNNTVETFNLAPYLIDAKKELVEYIKKPSEKIEPTQYGLSRPRTVCTNRVKCTGIDKTGKLHKGYKFQEGTGHVVKVRKSKLGRTKCVNRVKCTGLTKAGKLMKGYKFEEGTNNVIKVSTAKKKKTQSKLGRIVQVIEHTPMQEIHHSPVVQILNDNSKLGYTPPPTPVHEFENEPEEKQATNPPFIENEVRTLSKKYKTALDRMKENKNANIEVFELQGDLQIFLGKIERKPVHSLAITLDTEEGGGKTHAIYQWANEFYESGYNPVIWSLEEHASSSLSTTKAEKYFGRNISNIPILSEEPDDSKEQTYQKFVDSIADFDVIFIDSWNKLVEINNIIKFDQDIRKKFHGKIFIVVVQRTADGKMRGGSSVAFDGDIILKGFVDRVDFRNNYLYNHKNRYNEYVPLLELKYSPYYQSLLPKEINQVQEI